MYLVMSLIEAIINFMVKLTDPIKLVGWVLGKILMFVLPAAIVIYSVVQLTDNDSKTIIKSVEESRTLAIADSTKKSSEAIQEYIQSAKESVKLVEEVKAATVEVSLLTEQIKTKRDIKVAIIRKKKSTTPITQPVVDQDLEESRANIEAMWDSYCLVNKHCGDV